MSGVRDVGARIEELLTILRGSGGPGVAAAAEDLVSLLVNLYGDGLAHIMASLGAEGETGAAAVDRLVADPLVESLLLLHGLHPLDVDTRIQRALDNVRPYLGSHAGGVEYLGVTADGTARLRLEGSCHGCPSSTVTVQLAIQGAVAGAAPEVSRVVVEGVSEPPGAPLLTIGRRPPDGQSEGEMGTDAGGGDARWVSLPGSGPPTGRPVVVVAEGTAVLVCSVRGTLYAYRDSCPLCGSSLADGVLDGARLACPGCRTHYDVRSAGKGLDDPTCHLDPLPLLCDSRGVRVALPHAVRS
jgi:Fe-S cluster biogenesis protein NfuA/nitrite reductase/ring-hydroxylating ferredoxin subunit